MVSKKELKNQISFLRDEINRLRTDLTEIQGRFMYLADRLGYFFNPWMPIKREENEDNKS